MERLADDGEPAAPQAPRGPAPSPSRSESPSPTGPPEPAGEPAGGPGRARHHPASSGGRPARAAGGGGRSDSGRCPGQVRRRLSGLGPDERRARRASARGGGRFLALTGSAANRN